MSAGWSELPALRESELPARVPRPAHTPLPARVAAHPRWKTYAAQASVRALAADPERDELWVASTGGVVRWQKGDTAFTRYGSEHGLPGQDVLDVAVGAHGHAWALSAGGTLSVLDGDSWRAYDTPAGAVTCIARDEAGRLWAGGQCGVAVIEALDAGSVELLRCDPDSPLAAPRAIAPRDLDDAWMCTALGLFRRRGAEWQPVEREGAIVSLIRHGDALWVGDAARGLVLLGREARPWPRGPARALTQAREGVWAVAGGEFGLARPDSWTHHADLDAASIRAAATVSERLYVGTTGGVWRNEGHGFQPQLTDEPPDVVGAVGMGGAPATLSNLVQALALDPSDSRLWIGTPNGTFVLDPESAALHWRRIDGDVRAIAAVPDGTGMLVGSFSAGLVRASPDGDAVLINNSVVAVAPADGWMWAAGTTNVYAGEGDSFEARPLRGPRIARALAPSPDGTYLGTSNGLLCLAPGGTSQDTAGELGARDVLALVEAGDGRVYVGTDAGLYGGKHGEFIVVPGTEDSAVGALAFDAASGQLWAGTDRGLLSILEDGQEGGLLTMRNSGLPDNRIGALAVDSGRSRLWVGTPCGLAFTDTS